ncbi:prolipoprotein diacylglyceryl transferase [Salinarimonas sp.]|uniref:prolipoprotein diacylglyceryl transferase n=1 Tax=Salinarimonas sp. TaxID=2766526 RepID=UPI00391B34A3
MIFPDFDPIAFSIGPIAIRWYALAYLAGLGLGWLGARALVSRAALWGATKRPTKDDIDDLVVYVALGVILGGRLGYVLFYAPAYYLANPLAILYVWQGGMAFHGGLIGAALAVWLLARARGLSALALFDVVTVVAPIGLFFGRLANFVNGELWGRPAAEGFPFAMVFPDVDPVLRYPSQLIEAATQGPILFAIVLLVVMRYGFRRPGLVAGAFGIGYAAARIFSEFYREPDPFYGFIVTLPGFEGGLTMGMLLSIPVGLAGLALVLLARRGGTAAARDGARGA